MRKILEIAATFTPTVFLSQSGNANLQVIVVPIPAMIHTKRSIFSHLTGDEETNAKDWSDEYVAGIAKHRKVDIHERPVKYSIKNDFLALPVNYRTKTGKDAADFAFANMVTGAYAEVITTLTEAEYWDALDIAYREHSAAAKEMKKDAKPKKRKTKDTLTGTDAADLSSLSTISAFEDQGMPSMPVIPIYGAATAAVSSSCLDNSSAASSDCGTL